VIFLDFWVFLIFLPSHGRITPVIGIARTQIFAFRSALELFEVDNDFFPPGTNGLRDLVVQPTGATNWHQRLDKIPLAGC